MKQSAAYIRNKTQNLYLANIKYCTLVWYAFHNLQTWHGVGTIVTASQQWWGKRKIGHLIELFYDLCVLLVLLFLFLLRQIYDWLIDKEMNMYLRWSGAVYHVPMSAKNKAKKTTTENSLTLYVYRCRTWRVYLSKQKLDNRSDMHSNCAVSYTHLTLPTNREV